MTLTNKSVLVIVIKQGLQTGYRLIEKDLFTAMYQPTGVVDIQLPDDVLSQLIKILSLKSKSTDQGTEYYL